MAPVVSFTHDFAEGMSASLLVVPGIIWLKESLAVGIAQCGFLN